MAEFSLNGKPRSVMSGTTLEVLLVELGLDPRWIVAELNGEPVSRARFGEAAITPGDRRELVKPVAGG